MVMEETLRLWSFTRFNNLSEVSIMALWLWSSPLPIFHRFEQFPRLRIGALRPRSSPWIHHISPISPLFRVSAMALCEPTHFNEIPIFLRFPYISGVSGETLCNLTYFLDFPSINLFPQLPVVGGEGLRDPTHFPDFPGFLISQGWKVSLLT